MLNKIIFAIDNDSDVHAVAKFTRHVDTCRAMKTLKGSFIQCIGSYEGALEVSYMMDERDYRALIEPLGFTKAQECILHVPADTRQPCSLEYKDSDVILAPMRRVSAKEAMECMSWTYVPETNNYFTTEKE